nr:immunoglobulin light chain junction region [Macaca mulatta]MPN93241.1 immunoglobulin light chain junction region [Macaca mulatta]MPN93472.1 immunoglobulin light chain junction region [Macaca mulatta]MPN99032.1 immunoglobulin light chain junction region [Macaca mulatta]MPO00234.1 immunoglobulin light chain junction region [Macaca mulatta]
CQQYNSVPPTF